MLKMLLLSIIFSFIGGIGIVIQYLFKLLKIRGNETINTILVILFFGGIINVMLILLIEFIKMI
jgi:hypothetical protein